MKHKVAAALNVQTNKLRGIYEGNSKITYIEKLFWNFDRISTTLILENEKLNFTSFTKLRLV
jgi:hypothetical protein